MNLGHYPTLIIRKNEPFHPPLKSKHNSEFASDTET